MTHLLCFGLGFSARVLAARLAARGWTISATSRTAAGAAAIAAMGYRGWIFDGTSPLGDAAFDGVTHIVDSAPPGAEGDPVIARNRPQLAARARQITWVAYLSTTGVYGDHAGGWVDEDTPLTPNTERGWKRVEAETQWLDLWRETGFPIHLFRLAGIYGPGRNQLLSIRDGSARRIIKPGQVFSRIHVEDIARVLEASMAHAKSRPRLQRLRRRGLSAAGCDRPCRRASRAPGAAGHSVCRSRSFSHGAQFLCRLEARFECPHQVRTWRDAGLSHLSRRAGCPGEGPYRLTPSERCASAITVSRMMRSWPGVDRRWSPALMTVSVMSGPRRAS